MLHDWLKNTHSIFHPVRSKTKSNHDSFEHLSVLFMLATGICNKLLLLIGSLYCLCNLWLAGGITLVLVLWRSIGNCFNTQQRNKCKGKTTSGKTVGTRTTLESRGVGGGRGIGTISKLYGYVLLRGVWFSGSLVWVSVWISDRFGLQWCINTLVWNKRLYPGF